MTWESKEPYQQPHATVSAGAKINTRRTSQIGRFPLVPAGIKQSLPRILSEENTVSPQCLPSEPLTGPK